MEFIWLFSSACCRWKPTSSRIIWGNNPALRYAGLTSASAVRASSSRKNNDKNGILCAADACEMIGVALRGLLGRQAATTKMPGNPKSHDIACITNRIKRTVLQQDAGQTVQCSSFLADGVGRFTQSHKFYRARTKVLKELSRMPAVEAFFPPQSSRRSAFFRGYNAPYR